MAEVPMLSSPPKDDASTAVETSRSMHSPTKEEGWIVEALSRTIRLLPHRDDCGGFFVAAIRCEAAPELPTNYQSMKGAVTTFEASIPTSEDQGISEADQLTRLSRSSEEWRQIADFYAIERLEGELLWLPSRAREYRLLVSVTSHMQSVLYLLGSLTYCLPVSFSSTAEALFSFTGRGKRASASLEGALPVWRVQIVALRRMNY